MIFGFNTDVQRNDVTYHVQTEDRGAKNPIIDSMIYVGGKIVERVRTPYSPAATPQEEVETLVRNQHRELLESIRSGAFQPSASRAPEPPPTLSGYGLRLLNRDGIARDGQLQFEFSVWNRAEAEPAAGALLDLRWMPEGEPSQKVMLQAGDDGEAIACFPVPETARDISLLVCAKGSAGHEIAKFHVGSRLVAGDH